MLVDCLSRMQGNLHVRFLGEGVAARLSPYPTDEEGSTPFARSTRHLEQTARFDPRRSSGIPKELQHSEEKERSPQRRGRHEHAFPCCLAAWRKACAGRDRGPLFHIRK